MLSNLKACHHVCKILCQITQRQDVIPSRVQVLLRLERKLGFDRYIPHLIRIYKVFRPDLIVYRPSYVKAFLPVPRSLQEPLIAARARIEAEDITPDHHHVLWPNVGVKRKANPFHEPYALPQPEVLVYTDKLEEQKKMMISVLQFKSISEMIKHVSLWKVWRWPNSASTLLWHPATIALFRPHLPHVKIAITNWLEIALRAEVIDQLGNPSLQRQESLLQACIELLKETETMVPAVYHFLIEFFVMWDKFSHFPKILELLSHIPFISSSTFLVSFMQSISEIMATADVSLVSAILDAFSNTCLTWAMQADRERTAAKSETSSWPLASDEVNPIEGIHFLTVRLERMMMAAVLRLGPLPLLLISIINYYSKVNMGCDVLNLPLVLLPPPEFFFVVLTWANIVATHQLGHLLSRMKMRMQKIKSLNVSGDESLMRSVSLLSVESINFCVTIYLDTVLKRKSFNNDWMNTLAPFIGVRFLKKLTSVEGIIAYGNILQALNYIPLSLHSFVHERSSPADTEQALVPSAKSTDDLAQLKLDGIQICATSFMQKG